MGYGRWDRTWLAGQHIPSTQSGRPCRGGTIWMTGLPGAGKTSLAQACMQVLTSVGRPARVLDGDALRTGLNADLGFSPTDRAESARRVGEVALLFAEMGVVALVPMVSPYQVDRERIRQLHSRSRFKFVEVHVATPLEICEERDPKGLYASARAGILKELTGIDAPYEEPMHPELRVVLRHAEDIDRAVTEIVGYLGDPTYVG